MPRLFEAMTRHTPSNLPSAHRFGKKWSRYSKKILAQRIQARIDEAPFVDNHADKATKRTRAKALARRASVATAFRT